MDAFQQERNLRGSDDSVLRERRTHLRSRCECVRAARSRVQGPSSRRANGLPQEIARVLLSRPRHLSPVSHRSSLTLTCGLVAAGELTMSGLRDNRSLRLYRKAEGEARARCGPLRVPQSSRKETARPSGASRTSDRTAVAKPPPESMLPVTCYPRPAGAVDSMGPGCETRPGPMLGGFLCDARDRRSVCAQFGLRPRSLALASRCSAPYRPLSCGLAAPGGSAFRGCVVKLQEGRSWWSPGCLESFRSSGVGHRTREWK